MSEGGSGALCAHARVRPGILGEAFARANATTAAAEGRAVESYDGSGLVERARADARFKRVKRWTPGGMFDGLSTGGL